MRRTCSPTAALLAAAATTSILLSGPTTSDAFSPSLLPSSVMAATHHHHHHHSAPSRPRPQQRRNSVAPLQLSALPPDIQNQPTELPDSLTDAAAIAANACQQLSVTSGTTVRCRVDFDTSIGDETYTMLKSSTDFMQQFVSSLCLASIQGVREWKMDGAMKLVEAKAELRELQQTIQEMGLNNGEDQGDFFDGDESVDGGDEAAADKSKSEEATQLAKKADELSQIIANGGSDPASQWTGPKVRIYFPDEGSAALARRDWASQMPPCVEFSSCGGVQVADASKDAIILFYCPRASESEMVEEILYKAEETRGGGLLMSIMVNPLLVDMGVTGFGMAGRRLRERLIDGLIPAYYLRTLPWGALTRVWPQLFTVWQEDEVAEGGYRMIKATDRLPSNPEVEDIYDIENGDMNAPQEGLGILNAIGDFVNGLQMM